MNIFFDNLESLIDAPNGIEKARELILQFAIQGKLTEQDPKDEPASELLKKIRNEKEKLIAEGKIKKQKELQSIKPETIPFEIPNNWIWCKLDDITNINGGFAFKSDKYVYDGVRVIRISDFDDRGIKENKIVRYNYSEDIEQYRLLSNDILLAMTGGTVGKSFLIEKLDEPMFVNQRVATIRTLEPLFATYTSFIIKSPLTQSIIQVRKNSTNDNISMEDIRNFFVPLPPLYEQKRIVEKVNSLMALLDELEEKRERRNQKRIKLNNASLEKLLTSKDDIELKTNWKLIEENFSTLYSVPENVEKLKQAILQLAVQGKLVKQDPNDEPASELLKKIKKEKEKLIAEGKIKKQNELPPIKDEDLPAVAGKPLALPKGWEWVRLGDIGIINPRNDIPDNLKVSFIPMALISEKFGEIAKSEIKTWVEIKKGFTHFANDDVGLAKITPCFENGKAAVFRDLVNGYGAGTTELHIFRRTGNNINSDFIYIIIKSPFFVDGGKLQMTGTAGQQRISKDYFQNYVFALPPYAEQKRIVEKVNELLSLCNALEEKLTKKEATAEKLVGAVVNLVANKTNKPKDDKADKKEMINALIKRHPKALEKLS